MSVFVPLPGNDFLEWANNLTDYFGSTYTVPLATDEENWREWATSFFLASPFLTNFPIPSEALYPNKEDWKKWAEFFCNNIYTQ